jgi:hypothetical protein
MWPGGVGLTPGRTRGTVVMRPKGSGVWLTADARPDTCLHQMPLRIEARVLELRALHPGWGPRSILNASNEGAEPLPGERRSIGPWCATNNGSIPAVGAVGRATTSDGSARGRFSLGRCTSPVV